MTYLNVIIAELMAKTCRGELLKEDMRLRDEIEETLKESDEEDIILEKLMQEFENSLAINRRK